MHPRPRNRPPALHNRHYEGAFGGREASNDAKERLKRPRCIDMPSFRGSGGRISSRPARPPPPPFHRPAAVAVPPTHRPRFSADSIFEISVDGNYRKGLVSTPAIHVGCFCSFRARRISGRQCQQIPRSRPALVGGRCFADRPAFCEGISRVSRSSAQVRPIPQPLAGSGRYAFVGRQPLC